MEVINGEFSMLGCREDDPGCIRSPEELKRLISEIGFLPLFSNTIPGFSVEERTLASAWWTGDPASDPWTWREFLSSDPELAYGKFYDKKAGYVSKEWFPAFANYRRNGYDFDALVGDELVPYRNQQIMEAFSLQEDLTGDELMSYEVKERVSVKNHEGCMTELQMQTYLLMSAFRQKKNKKGQPYGWHVAAFTTPETKWGYEYISSGYHEKPEESWERIMDQIRKHFPQAGEAELKKLLGIRYPGESIQKEQKTRKTKPVQSARGAE